MGVSKAPEIVARHKLASVAEIGVLHGVTTLQLAKVMPAGGTLHLFDFQDILDKLKDQLTATRSEINYVYHGNTRKSRDSYAWTLMKMIQQGSPIRLDYIYLDGSHSYAIDGLATVLLDRFLKVGGFIEFDDYAWTWQQHLDNYNRREKDPSKQKVLADRVNGWYTREQMATPHVKKVVDMLVKPSPHYEEVQPDRIYRKVSQTGLGLC